MHDSAELFNTASCFALVAQDGADGHAALAERIAREEAARDLEACQLALPVAGQLDTMPAAPESRARVQFVPDACARHAFSACPWAVTLIGSRGGFWCFESRDDAREWKGTP